MDYIQSSELGVTVKLLGTPLAAEATSPVILCVLLGADQHEATITDPSLCNKGVVLLTSRRS